MNARKKPNPIEKYQFIHYFVPHPHHKKRAVLLQSYSIIIYVILVLAVFPLFKIIPKNFPGVLGYASNIYITELFELTNQKRIENGQSSLVLNPNLSKAAEEKAKHMFENNYWAHIAPDGTSPWKFILDQNYDYSYAGENLAKNFNDSAAVVDAWMNSPSHRDNLLSPNYDEIGFAVVNGVLDGYETTLVVQMFGRPRNPNAIVTAEQSQQFFAQLPVPVTEPLEVSVPKVETLITSSRPGMSTDFVDITYASKYIAVAFGVFFIILLVVDIWYSKRKGIPKITGHTLAHILFLAIVLFGVLFLLTPGVVL